MMRWERQTEALIRQDSLRMRCLEAARSLMLPDWFIGAGFLRNAIWDHLHQRPGTTPLNDVDLVYFDPDDARQESEQGFEAGLKTLCPEVTWEVRNQARMHLKHGLRPFQNTSDGIAHWVETQTCVGVRLTMKNRLSFTAPYGLEENWSLRVSMCTRNPRAALFTQRVKDKLWQALWPRLQIDWPDCDAEVSDR